MSFISQKTNSNTKHMAKLFKSQFSTLVFLLLFLLLIWSSIRCVCETVDIFCFFFFISNRCSRCYSKIVQCFRWICWLSLFFNRLSFYRLIACQTERGSHWPREKKKRSNLYCREKNRIESQQLAKEEMQWKLGANLSCVYLFASYDSASFAMPLFFMCCIFLSSIQCVYGTFGSAHYTIHVRLYVFAAHKRIPTNTLTSIHTRTAHK